VRAVLSGHGESCLLEISVERAAYPLADCVWVEVLYQTRASNGLPVGAPALLHRTELPLATLPSGLRARAQTWLPQGLGLATARNCHFRVVPDMMRTSPEKGPEQDINDADSQE